MVQHELRRRKESGLKYSGNTCFSGKIVCGECGGMFGSKVWHSTDRYRSVIWQCNRKFKNDKRCSMPHLKEETIKAAFVKVVNDVLRRKDEVFSACDEVIAILADTRALEAERIEAKSSVDELQAAMRQAILENARTTQDQKEYDARYAELTRRYHEAGDCLNAIDERLHEHKAKRVALEAYMVTLKSRGEIAEFDEGLWSATVETVTVNADGTLIFHWKDGSEAVWEG